jgi:DNA helicase-2/ATP-dependent DNA helicase PcrA
MTVHQAKGLEFPVVIVDSLEAVPRKQYTELDEILQASFYRKPPFEPLERTKYFDFWRLYYTAFSRSQNLLVLSAPENLDGPGKKVPSEPFSDLYTALPTWRDAQVALAEIVLATIQDSDLKRRYSFTSHITVYENCARQYKFFKELDFAPVRSGAILFGTLVHQTIEDIHKAALRGETDRISKPQIETWLRNNYRQLVAKERRYLPEPSIKSALEQVNRYVEYVTKTHAGWHQIQAAEVDVSLVRDTYILEGSVDLIQGGNNTVEVVDLKAERKPDLEGEPERVQRYRRQLEIYGYLIEQRLGKKVTRLHIHYTGEKLGNPRLSFPMDPDSVKRTIAVFDQTVERIEQKAFEIKERPKKLCMDCDMRHYCDRQ